LLYFEVFIYIENDSNVKHYLTIKNIPKDLTFNYEDSLILFEIGGDMKVFISVDMEGIAGISSWRETKRGNPDYQACKKLATDEVNAVVRGIKKAKAKIEEMLICDSHAMGENILINELDKDVSLTKGYPRPYYMLYGLDESYDILFLIGYHTKIGTMFGPMDHSYSPSTVYNIKINGNYVGELEINAGLAGHYKVPVGLVSGDAKFIEQAKELLGKDVETVVTKYGISRFASKNIHPKKIHEELEIKSKRAIEKSSKLKPLKFKTPLKAEIDLLNTVMADEVALLPNVERKSGRTIAFETDDFPTFYRMMTAIMHLAAATRSWE
jgi:D-amino peptidase